jgi:Transposase
MSVAISGCVYLAWTDGLDLLEHGKKKSSHIRLAVMDMWKPFRLATNAYAPQAAILFDKFHVMRHLGEALDAVRKNEYARVQGRQRRYIKGQKYTLLSRRENLTLDRSCPPCKARTIDRPNEFKIRGWSDWLHFDAEGEQLEGAVLDGGEFRIEDEVRLRGAVHGLATTEGRAASAAALSWSSNRIGLSFWRMCHST